MAHAPKILAFAGSTRKESFNKKLINCAARSIQQHGGQPTVIDLSEYPLPLFDEDYEKEQGRPDAAARLVELFLEHDGLLISAPEYNSSITAVLKNTIDWVSRPIPHRKPLAAFKGKVAALLSASPGALGGLRGLVHVRSILGNIGVIVLPDQLAVPAADKAFDNSGSLQDEKHAKKLDQLTKALVDAVQKFCA